MAREDTYLKVRGHLDELTDEQLEARFWELAQRVVDPMVELARTHTSPSIERSVLMRMGVDSPTCMAVVGECEKRGLLGHGAGHVVLALRRPRGTAPRRRPRAGSPPARAGTSSSRSGEGAMNAAVAGIERGADGAPLRLPPLDPNEKLDLQALLEDLEQLPPAAQGLALARAGAGPAAAQVRLQGDVARASSAASRCRRPTTSATSTRSPTAW